jgi:hypothetical protein
MDFTAYLTDAKIVLDILKGAAAMIPRGNKSAEVEAKLQQAEASLNASEAELAKALGYKLCKCTYPPQIMLWKEQERANFCDRCGHRYPPAHKPPQRLAVR